jgi:putative membrane protein
MRYKNLAWATLLVALSASAVALADSKADDKSADKSNDAKLSDPELNILAHVHQVNQMEIDAGKVALAQSATPAIKTYAQMLITEHGQNDRDIQALARKHHQTIPAHEASTNEAERQAIIDAHAQLIGLAQINGADFDRQFLQMMVAGHASELARLMPELEEASSPDIKQLLQDMRPVLQKHEDRAREIENSAAQALR